MVIIYVIKGKIFSLHILQYQSAPVIPVNIPKAAITKYKVWML